MDFSSSVEESVLGYPPHSISEHRPSPPDEPLINLHQSSLRVRGVLHLLYEAMQSGKGISPSHAAAVCALIKNAETDLSEMGQSIDELVDLQVGRSRRRTTRFGWIG